MMLLTKSILNKLPKLYEMDGKEPENVPVVVKFFNPAGAATWYVTEFDGEDTFYGLCNLGIGPPEMGYISFSELQRIRGAFGLAIERDRYCKMTLAEAMTEAGYVRA